MVRGSKSAEDPRASGPLSETYMYAGCNIKKVSYEVILKA